jgi:hypothetical protein
MALSVYCVRADLEFVSGGLYRDGILIIILAGLHKNCAAQHGMWIPTVPVTFIGLRMLLERPD